jgi:hypothetical protein
MKLLCIFALLIIVSACTTARRPPWIVEQPLYKAPPPASQPLERSR